MTYRKLVLTLVAGLSAGAARAEGCEELGLPSEFLATYFCGAFEDIVAAGTTRDIVPETGDLPDGPGFEWLEIELLRDAYRADPRKTLELIQRIRTAGGLPES